MASRPANGQVPAAALTRVGKGAYMFAETATAAAFFAAQRENPKIAVAEPGGANRPLTVQADMKVHPQNWNLNPASSVKLAAVGQSTHGYGTALDIVGDSAWFLKNMARFGFSRPFGASDPNHFVYGAPTWEPVATVTNGTQRQVLPSNVANRRSIPSSKGDKGEPLPAGEVGNFNGWIHGELVTMNGVTTDVWFRGISGSWFWSGGFTDTGVHDLEDLNPKHEEPPTTGTTRKTSITANARTAPKTSAGISQVIVIGSSIELAGFVHGELVEQNNVKSDVWFVTKASNLYMWGGGFVGGPDVSGLTELTVGSTDPDTGTKPPVETTPTPTPDGSVLNTDYKSFTADSPLATWIGSPNFGKRAAAKKDHITLHWMSGTLPGTDSAFQKITQPITNGRSMGVATTYGVGPTAIHQYIKEDQYQHGDGDAGSNASGISIEHEGGILQADGTYSPVTQATLDLSASLCADVAKRLGLGKLELGVNVFPHNHWVPTMCPGTLDMDYIVDKANEHNGYVDTPPDNGGGGIPIPDPTDTGLDAVQGLRAVRDALTVFLGN